MASARFLEAYVAELREIELRYGTRSSVDVAFVAFLRSLASFGYFSLGPISISIQHVEEALDRRVARGEASTRSDDFVRMSSLAAESAALAGRPRIEELDYLIAFMRFDGGLPAEVFGELGVSPEQVHAALRDQRALGTHALPALMTPEEVAAYLQVNVATVDRKSVV